MTVLHSALKVMIERSSADGVDYKGFNAADENTARALLSSVTWENGEPLKARRLCWKYRKQLGKLGFYYDRATRLWAKRDLTQKTLAVRSSRSVTRDETPVEVKAAIIVRAKNATKVWLPTSKASFWVANPKMNFRSEGFQPGSRSNRMFEVGMLTVPAYQIAQATA